MKQPIYAVVVLYNVNYKKSRTFMDIVGLPDVSLIVCDNSTVDVGNYELADDYPEVTYISMGHNAGLSAAYNRAIHKLEGKTGYLCLFDDDTQVGADYFSALREEIDRTRADIYLPLVYDLQGLMSPCIMSGVRTHRVSSVEEIPPGQISGINSGMAVNLAVYRDYRYDEGYFLDYVDHAFLRDVKAQGRTVLPLCGAALQQDFSLNERADVLGAKVRFRLFYRDFYRFCSVSFSARCFAVLYILKRWLYINLVMRIGGRRKKSSAAGEEKAK
ncbi:MAG: glycosyltransferase [Candidatus Howiella sp.]|jgi:rhamnosyltransferase